MCLKTDSEETRHKQVLRINEWPSCARPFYTVTYLDKTRGFYAEDFVQGVSTMLYVTFSVSEGTSSQYEFKAKEIPVCPTCGKPMKYLTIVCTYLIDY